MNFAERLRLLREKAGFSQAALAAKVNIKPNAYNKIETRGTQPGPEMLIELAKALGCSVDELVGYTPPAEEESIFKALSELGIVIAPAEKTGFYTVSYPAEETSWDLTIDEIIKYYKATLEDDYIKTNLAKQFTLEVLLS